MNIKLQHYLKKNRKLVDRALNRYLPKASVKPRIIHKAMRYSVFAGGKRLRPILVIAAAEACGGKANMVLPAACAMELIHTYSLIHDDLPAMDNDDLRRGRPTNHKVFGEDIAILAGDALLTHAFALIHENAKIPGVKANSISQVLQILTQGAGTSGMIGGQVADIQSDQGRWKKDKKPGALLKFIHAKKTAALISASLQVGGCLVGASPKQEKALKSLGTNMGLAFQVRDDILDRVGDKKKLGKKGSDLHNQKLTYPALYGLEKSENMARSYITRSFTSIRDLSRNSIIINELAKYVLLRDC